MNFLGALLFFITSGLNSTGQLLLKRGSLLVKPIFSGDDPIVIKLVKVLLNPFIDTAIVCLVIGMFLWIKILGSTQLSTAYPINIALTVIITSTASVLLFNESMSLLKGFGIVLIVVGIWSIIVG
jgi:multidrug transporter EmrE-like cation transporter